MKGVEFYHVQSSLMALFVAVSVGIWSYLAYNGRFFMEIDSFVQMHSSMHARADGTASKPVAVSATELFDISFIWLKDEDDFQAHQFYILDSYLQYYPNARIQVYASKLSGRFFAEYSQMGYSVSVVPITADLFKSLAKSCPFMKDWIDNRFNYRQQSPHYDSYLADFLKGCLLCQKNGIAASFDVFLLNPVERLFSKDSLVFDSSFQFAATFSSSKHLSTLKACMLSNFSKSLQEFINRPSNLGQLMKDSVDSHKNLYCIDDLVALSDNFLVPTTDKHQFLKTSQLLNDFYLVLQVSSATGEDSLFDDENPFSMYLFNAQLYNRQEESDIYIKTSKYLIRDAALEELYVKQSDFASDNLWFAKMHNFGFVPGHADLGSKQVEFTLHCKNCNGFSFETKEKWISLHNPLQLNSSSIKSLNDKLSKIRILMNNNIKKESIIITATVKLDGKSKSAAFPLYNISNEVSVVTFKRPEMPAETFLSMLKSIAYEYKGISLLVAIWQNDTSWNKSVQGTNASNGLLPSELAAMVAECPTIAVHNFPENSSTSTVLNELIGKVESENFAVIDPAFYSYSHGCGTLEKLIFQMNSFDVVGAEPVDLEHKTLNFGYGNFYKNINEGSLKIKLKSFANSVEHFENFSQCFPVNYVGPFFLSKTFLFKDMIKFDSDSFKSSNDWGYLEDLFLTLKKKKDILTGVCPLALVPASKVKSHDLSADAFFRKHAEYEKVVVFDQIMPKEKQDTSK